MNENLAGGESITVPTGETWVVDVTVASFDGNTDDVNVNANRFTRTGDSNNSLDQVEHTHHTFTEGDTIKSADTGSVHIGGFAV